MELYLKFKEFFSHFYLAMEWRVIGATITFIVVYIVSGDIKISLSIASIESVVKIVTQIIWLKYRVKKYHLKNHHI